MVAYRKQGVIHFVTIWRFGFSFHMKKASDTMTRKMEIERKNAKLLKARMRKITGAIVTAEKSRNRASR